MGRGDRVVSQECRLLQAKLVGEQPLSPEGAAEIGRICTTELYAKRIHPPFDLSIERTLPQRIHTEDFPH
jgi:hypothetical protein